MIQANALFSQTNKFLQFEFLLLASCRERLGGIGIIGRIVHLLSPDTLQLLELSSAVTLQIQHFKLHWNLFTVNTDRVNLEQERGLQTCKRCSKWRAQFILKLTIDQ